MDKDFLKRLDEKLQKQTADRGNLTLSQFYLCVYVQLNKDNLCKPKIA